MACSIEDVAYLEWVRGGVKRVRNISVDAKYNSAIELNKVNDFVLHFEAVHRDAIHKAEILARQPGQGLISPTKQIYDPLLSCGNESAADIASRKSMLRQAVNLYEESGDYLMAQKSQEKLLALLTETDGSAVNVIVLGEIRRLVDLYDKVSARLGTIAEALGLNVWMTLAVSPVLHRAIGQNNVLLVSEALRRVEKWNDIDFLGRDALHCAVESRTLPILQFLIQRGYPLYRSDFGDNIPLYLAAEMGFIEGVRNLIEAEGRDSWNQNDLNHPRWRVLRTAVERGYLAVAGLRIDAAILVTSEGAKGRHQTAFVAAARGGNLRVVQLLLERGVDVNGRADERRERTAIQAAAEYGHLQIVEHLLANGADINAEGGFRGLTALQAAASGGYLNTVRSLITNGADVNAPDYEGQTALYYAAGQGHRLILELIIERGATIHQDPEFNDDLNGSEIINYAREGEHLDIVRRLVALGAVDSRGLEAAVKQGNLELVETMIKYQDSIGGAASIQNARLLHAAAHCGHLEIVQFLINRGIDANNNLTDDLELVLHAAAENGHLAIVKFMIMMGANINAHRPGCTALDMAAGEGHIEVVRCLIMNGVDINARRSLDNSITALWVAANSGHLDVVKLLVQSGANVNSPAGRGCGGTALQAAASRNIDIVKFLIESGADLHAGDRKSVV